MLKQTLPIFKLGLGGKIVSGEQFFSWVHIDDIKHAFDFFIKDTSQKGVYNLTSPKPCSNYIFTKKLGRVINRPTIFAVPSYIIKIIFGEMGDKLLLHGSAIYPKNLLSNGYKFRFENIKSALEDILK